MSDVSMDNPNQPQSVKPICPRCAYDQSGEASRWTASCPVRGTCPECGLEFHWTDLYHPHRLLIPWYYEHARAWSPGLVRLVRSCLVLLYPFALFRRITVEVAPRPRRLAWLAVLLIVVPWSLRAVCLSAVALISPPSVPMGITRSTLSQVVEPWLWPFLRRQWWWGENDKAIITIDGDAYVTMTHMWPSAAVFAMGLIVMPGIILALLTTSRRVSKVRWSHLFRCFIWGLFPVCLMIWSRTLSAMGHLFFTVNDEYLKFKLHGPQYVCNEIEKFFLEHRQHLALPAVIWLIAYWCAALSRGLRLPKAWLVATLCLIAAALLGAIFTLISGVRLDWLA